MKDYQASTWFKFVLLIEICMITLLIYFYPAVLFSSAEEQQAFV